MESGFTKQNGLQIATRRMVIFNTPCCIRQFVAQVGISRSNSLSNNFTNKESDRTRYELYDILKTEVGRCGNWNVLVANLKRQGVDVHFRHKGQTDEIQGEVFIKNGYHFNGSKVDKRFSYSKIDAALQHNRYEERKGMRIEVHEVATPSAPSGTVYGELFNGSLGLLNGNSSSYNAADAETNQEMAEILHRKKKRRWGMRL